MRFQSGGFASPARRPANFTSRTDCLLFCAFISNGFHAGGFCISGRKCSPVCRTVYSFISAGFQAGGFCISGCQSTRLPRPRTSLSSFASRAVNPACRLTLFACRAANPTRPPKPRISQSFFASRTSKPACRLTFLHVGHLYPMYSCLYVCVSACIYACKHACMHACIHAYMYCNIYVLYVRMCVATSS